MQFASRAALSAIITAFFAFSLTTSPCATAGDLPVAAGNWVQSGQATYSISGNTMNIQAGVPSQPNVTLNWESFRIGQENTVNFQQPSSSAVALNKVLGADPTVILGRMNANGEVYLINRNGIVFGNGAQVNVRGLVSSTLNIAPDAEKLGLTVPLTNGQAAFEAGAGGAKDIRVEQGASITTPSQGRVLLLAPNVTNEGRISTPDGTTTLAAGQKIYIGAQGNGLVVEVGQGGTVTNGSVSSPGAGQISADRGTATLVGMAVNQLGRINASTAVRQAGKIQLKARESNAIPGGGGATPQTGGTVVFGASSVTDVSPDTGDTATEPDSNPQPHGQVVVAGKSINLKSGSQINARGGTVTLTASTQGRDQGTAAPTSNVADARVRIDSGARIDVSGLSASLPAERNALTWKLQSDEFKDRPVQRNGSLYRKEVVVDLRRRGRLADGTEWVGTPIADLRQAAQTVRRGIAERNGAAGSVTIESQGDVVIAPGATIDMSGGTVRYAGGTVQTTWLSLGGRVVNIADADPNIVYDGIFGELLVEHPKWGSTDRYLHGLFDTGGVTTGGSGGYVEGRDAGSLGIASPLAIIEGELLARVQRGKNQRKATNDTRGNTHAFDEMPLGGALTVGAAPQNGSDFATPSVVFSAAGVASRLAGVDVGTAAFPANARDSVVLSQQLFGSDRITDLTVRSNGRIALGSDIGLDLGVGGRLSLTGKQIDIGGRVIAHGGDVSLKTGATGGPTSPGNYEVRLASGSLIEVSGEWINDTQNRAGTLAPIVIDAGSVTISAQSPIRGAGGIRIERGASIRADGGAQFSGAGKLLAGAGGDISLSAAPNGSPLTTVIDGELSGYGLKQGGTLSLLTSDICISTSTCGAAAGQSLINPSRFSDGGFHAFNLTAEGGGLTVASGTTVQLQQKNFIMPGGVARASGGTLRDFAGVGTLPDFYRKPVNLSLNTRLDADNAVASQLFDNDRLATAPLLTVDTGARILGEAGAAITLSSSSRMYVDGEIAAPAGSIALSLEGGSQFTPGSRFVAAQTLWVGSNARLSATGAVKMKPNRLGLQLGEVLDAGSVRLNAKSGFVVAEAGSFVDVSAVRADLDIVPAGESRVTRQTIGGAAGSVTLRAAEGIVFDGEMAAKPATPFGEAGSLTVTLDAAGRSDSGDPQIAPNLGIPTNARTVVLTGRDDRLLPQSVQAGDALPQELIGRATLSARKIVRAGFGDVRVQARNIYRIATGENVAGIVRLEGSPSLNVSRRLEVIAAGIESDGSVASLGAPYVAIGNDDDADEDQFRSLPALAGGPGRLNVSADNIDLIGSTRLLGFASTELRSSGDVRLRGVEIKTRPSLSGSVESTGDIGIAARQIYPTTLSQYTLAVRNNPNGAIRISSTAAGTPVLSAGGTVTLEAPTIAQGGTVKAPLGTVVLNAGSRLDLLPGSVTSTSLEGLTVPFGQVQLGRDWIYSLSKAERQLVFKAAGARAADAFPQQNVQLKGNQINLAPGAVVDASGGGDLLAYEFKPGLGGTVDVLDAANSDGAFAIIPGLGSDYAPIDPQESKGFGIDPGTSVELSGGAAGLPAGRYAVLPARYALLPGAFLVKRVDGYADLQRGNAISPPGGGTVVAGREVFANGSQGEARTSGYLVRSGTEVATLATYDTYRANQAGTLYEAARAPRDGGVLQVAAATRLDLGGLLRSVPGVGGRGAAAEFTGNRIDLVADATTGGASGTLRIAASGLNALGAESLIIGGNARRTAAGVSLDVSADTVTVEDGALLQAPEITLAAKDTLRVKGGARVSGTGRGSGRGDDFAIDGQGALLRASANPQVTVTRSNVPSVPTRGTLAIEQGAVVAADASMLLDSTLDTILGGDLAQAGGALTLSASKINLGTPASPVTGLTLTQADLAGIDVDDFLLRGRTGIDLFGSLDASFRQLTLDTPSLGGRGAAADAVRLAADVVNLRNTGGTAAAGLAPGQGRLRVDAGTVNVGAGTVDVSGFNGTAIAARGDIVGTAADGGKLEVAGDLDLISARLTGTTGAEFAIASTGELRSVGALTARGAVDGLGARLALTGSSIVHSGRIELPSGVVTLSATGAAASDNVTLASGGVIDVGGRAIEFVDYTAYTGAGDVTLRATTGDVAVESGALVNLAGVGPGKAGRLTVDAANGTVDLQGTVAAGARSAADGGRVSIDVARLGSFSVLNTALNAAQFSAERTLRLRTGEITVAVGDAVDAARVKLVADQGPITIDGLVGSAAARGAAVELSAHDDVTVRGRINAASRRSGEAGGDVALNSVAGGVFVENGATIDVSPVVDAGAAQADVFATRGGRMTVRVDRSVAATVADSSAANDRLRLPGSSIIGARAIDVIGYETTPEADGSLGAGDVQGGAGNARYAAADGFIQGNADGIRSGLGFAPADIRLRVRAGIGVETAPGQDLAIDSDWDLSPWRFHGEPGELTLRAGGNLTFNSSLSDGFQGMADLSDGFTQPVLLTDESWSYRLVAGADSGSADAMATTGSAGSLTIVPGVPGSSDAFFSVRPQQKAIRTGTGDISIAAAGDVVLSNRASVVYTAGRDPQTGIALGTPGTVGTLEGRAYPTAGGDLQVRAGGSVRGVATDLAADLNNHGNQLVTNWLYRQGGEAGVFSPEQATGWTVAHEWFEQGIGALGGGDVDVVAGGDVDNLSVVIPTIGRQVGGTDRASSRVEVDGGGNLTVEAGGDIRSGVFYVGKGVGSLSAGGGIVSGRPMAVGSATALHTILAVGDGRFEVSARRDVDIEAVLNPTLLPQARTQGRGDFFAPHSWFSTFGDAAGATLSSLTGDVTVHGGLYDALVRTENPFALDFSDAQPDNDISSLAIFAPQLKAVATAGDVNINGRFTLYPSRDGDVQLLADDSVNLRQSFAMSDADLALLPTTARPTATFLPLDVLNPFAAQSFSPTPLHAGKADDVARIIAKRGDVTYAGSTNPQYAVFLSKPGFISAGRDITSLNLLVQNNADVDVTTLSAGRDIVYPFERRTDGKFTSTTSGINIQGPGRLNLEAGRNIELGISAGVTSLGNTGNPALADSGANVSVTAGLNAGRPDYAAFARRYLAAGFRAAAAAYARKKEGNAGLSDDEAIAVFLALGDAEQQRAVYVALGNEIYEAFAAELRETGRANAPLDSASRDYGRGDRAIATLFPRADYRGDLNMFFSRIYTLDGGDIDLLAPGGLINVGLSTPPTGFGVSKQASELGVVAQSTGDVHAFLKGDFAVNESRVFAADGGDVLIWSNEGDIDAGRGAKSSISAPPPIITLDPVTGAVKVTFPPALNGSGIRTLTSTPGRAFGSVDLITPRGIVNASEAGIESQGNVTIAAVQVLGADNIKVGGTGTGVPTVDTGGLGGLAGVGDVASAATKSVTEQATKGVGEGDEKAAADTAKALASALSFISVEFLGYGEG